MATNKTLFTSASAGTLEAIAGEVGHANSDKVSGGPITNITEQSDAAGGSPELQAIRDRLRDSGYQAWVEGSGVVGKTDDTHTDRQDRL